MQERELCAHLHAELGVQVRQRLVHQERARLTHHGATHGDALTLSARELARLAFHQRVQAQDVRDVLHAPLQLVLRRLAESQAEPEVLLDGHVGVERVVLEDHRDVAFLRWEVGHLRVADEDLARRHLFEPREDAEDRRLPATGRTDQHHELAVADLERDVVHGDHVAAEHLASRRRGRSWPWLTAPSVGRESAFPRRSWVKERRRRACAPFGASSRSNPIIAAPTTGGAVQHAHLRGRARSRGDPSRSGRRTRDHPLRKIAASEHHVDVEPLHAQPSDGGSRHRHDLVGLAIDHLTRDGVALARHPEQDGRHLRQSLLVDAPEVDGLHELPRPFQPEMRGHRAFQRRLPAAAVLRTHGVPCGEPAEVAATAPVAGDRTDRGEPRDPPIGRHRRAVRPVAAHHTDSPRPVGSGAEHRERVVAKHLRFGPSVGAESIEAAGDRRPEGRRRPDRRRRDRRRGGGRRRSPPDARPPGSRRRRARDGALRSAAA